MHKKGFTLIELMIVISIVAVLVSIGTFAYFNSLKRSRDAKRKYDLSHISDALEIFYEDNRHYPLAGDYYNSKNALCLPTNDCSQKIYMKLIPKDPKSNQDYMYETDISGSFYRLYSNIESPDDTGQGVNQTGYEGNCNPSPCRFGLASPQTTLVPLTGSTAPL